MTFSILYMLVRKGEAGYTMLFIRRMLGLSCRALGVSFPYLNQLVWPQ